MHKSAVAIPILLLEAVVATYKWWVELRCAMSSMDFDLKTGIFSCNWASDWKKVQVKVNQAKDAAASSAENSVTEALVVNTLRAGDKPETIYWLLRYYVESNSNGSLINTDRGKSLYIDCDRLENTVSVYVGSTESITCIGDEDGLKIYTMDVQEKYEYTWYAFLGAALKRHYSAEAILDEARRNEMKSEAIVPTLFFTIGNTSSCVLRTDWCETYNDAFAPLEILGYEGYIDSLPTHHSGNVVSVFNMKSSKKRNN